MEIKTFSAICKTPFGEFPIYVKSNEQSARADIITAVVSEMALHPGIIRVGEVLATRLPARGKTAIRRCVTHSDSGKPIQWAWMGEKVQA